MRPKLLLTILAAAAVLTGCAKKEEKPRAERVPVLTATAERRSVPVEMHAIGSVQPINSIAVKSLVGGTLTRVWFAEGQDVRRGQMLFTIDPRPYQAELARAEANLARDEAQLKNAEAEAQRYASLVQQDFVTKQEADRALSARDVARANVAADRAAVENARLELSYCEIRSPMDGRTGGLMVHPGNLVKPNDVALVTINQISPVYVEFSVPESTLAEIRNQPMKSVTVSARPKAGGAQLAEGVLSFIDNAVDPTTGTIALKATFSNQNRSLWPGQFVDLGVRVSTRDNVTVVPSSAVLASQKGTYVWVVGNDGGVVNRPVTVTDTIGDDAIVEAGIQPGDVVVTDGQLRLNPKSKIEVKQGV